MTIYEIKRRAVSTGNFFDRDTMKFFHQTLKDFRVEKSCKYPGTYYFHAHMRDMEGRIVGETERWFDPTTNKILRETMIESENIIFRNKVGEPKGLVEG